MTASLDRPEMVLLSVFLGPRPLGRALAVIPPLGRVLELVIAARADEDLLLVRHPVVPGVAGEARASRWRGLELRLGRGLATTPEPAKAVGLVVEVGWVVGQGVRVDGEPDVATNDLELVGRVGERRREPGDAQVDNVSQVATKVAQVAQVAHDGAAQALDPLSAVSLLQGHGERESPVHGDALSLLVGAVVGEVNDRSCRRVAQDAAVAAGKGGRAPVGLRHLPTGVSTMKGGREVAVQVVVVVVVVEEVDGISG